MTSQTSESSQTQKLWQGIKTEAPFFIMVIGVIFTFRLLFFGMNYIPSESMQPALEVGDRIVVNKMIYGYSRHSLPFSFAPRFPGEHGRILGRMPKRGEVVTFKNPVQKNKIFIKRVIGLPGDTVQYRGNRLFINGEPTPREKIDNYAYKGYKGPIFEVDLLTESLGDGKTFEIYEQTKNRRGDNTEEFVVPPGHLFVMGDNRDNSTDSRYAHGVAYLPIENLLGRAERVLFSTYRCKKREDLHCAKRHFFGKIK